MPGPSSENCTVTEPFSRFALMCSCWAPNLKAFSIKLRKACWRSVGSTSTSTEQMLVDVDPTLLQHAFRNLIENAFKFGAQQLHIKAKRENGSVTVQFSDDGPGIPPEDRERVFERFYQVDKDF